MKFRKKWKCEWASYVTWLWTSYSSDAKYSKNEVKPLKRRNLNQVIVPENINHFNEISEPQILNIDSKIPKFFQEFLSDESFSEIGKNILKYTNLFQNEEAHSLALGGHIRVTKTYSRIRRK